MLAQLTASDKRPELTLQTPETAPPVQNFRTELNIAEDSCKTSTLDQIEVKLSFEDQKTQIAFTTLALMSTDYKHNRISKKFLEKNGLCWNEKSTHVTEGLHNYPSLGMIEAIEMHGKSSPKWVEFHVTENITENSSYDVAFGDEFRSKAEISVPDDQPNEVSD